MFKKAVRKQAHLRLALMGPAGSGKTYSALLLAKHLGCKRIAVIDSERGSAKLYSDVVDFEVCELESFAAEKYIEAIVFAERAGFDCLIIDSLSHAWAGKDGILEYKDKRTDMSKSKDSFGAGWRDATPLHNKLVDTILAFKGHVIATLRTKTEYVLEQGPNGKMTPRRVGMAPVQRDGVEYEFTVVGDFIESEKLEITKSRCSALAGELIHRPGREMAETLLAWLQSGEAEAPARAPERAPEPAPAPTRSPTPAEGAAIAARAFPALKSQVDKIAADPSLSDEDKHHAIKALVKLEKTKAAGQGAPPATAPQPAADPALVAEARRLLAAADHADPGERAQIAALVREYTRGSGRVEDVGAADVGAFVSQLRALLDGPAVAA